MRKRVVLLLILILICVPFIIQIQTAALTIDYYGEYSAEAYHDYISSTLLPWNFVSYESVSQFGELESFGFCHPMDYKLQMTDSNIFTVSFSVYSSSEEELSVYEQIEHLPSGMTDMRNLTTEDVRIRIYIREGMKFCYSPKGEIECIYMFNEPTLLSYGCSIRIIGHRMWLKDYPMDGEETLMSRILSLDEEVSGKAIRELKSSILRHQISRLLLRIALISAVAILAIVAFVYFRKRRKQKIYKRYMEIPGEPTE